MVAPGLTRRVVRKVRTRAPSGARARTFSSDVKVSIEKDQLTVSGETKAEETKEGENYRRVERRYGTFERSFTLPKGVETDKIDANFKNGVLNLTVPKPVEVMPKQVEIN